MNSEPIGEATSTGNLPTSYSNPSLTGTPNQVETSGEGPLTGNPSTPVDLKEVQLQKKVNPYHLNKQLHLR